MAKDFAPTAPQTALRKALDWGVLMAGVMSLAVAVLASTALELEARSETAALTSATLIR